MDEKPKTDNKTGASPVSPAPEISEVLGGSPPKPATERQLQEVKNEMTAFERSALLWAKVAVGLSGLAAIFVCAQWYEMHTGGQDTHDLAEAAKTQANAAIVQSQRTESLATTAGIQATAALRQVEQLTALVRATNGAVEQAKRSAKTGEDSLALAQKSLEYQERPWAGVTSFSMKDDIAVGKTPAVVITILNSGKSPAIHLETKLRTDVVCGAFPRRPDYFMAQPGSKAIAMPGIPIESGESKYAIPLSQDFMNLLKADNCNLYAFGIINYADTFGKSHWRHACVVWQKDTPRALLVCGSYTDGDEDYPDGKEPN